MANEIDPKEMMARIVAIEDEIANSDAFDYPFAKAEAFPYWTNYMPTLTLNRDQNIFGEEITEAIPTIMATLAIGNMTSGMPGERETEFVAFAFAAARYFNQRPKLQSRSFPDGMDFTSYVECTNVTRAVGKSGAGDDVLLANFTLVLHLLEPLQFAYF